MIKQVKTFFNNPKGVFVGITVLLWVASLALVIADAITFEVYLGSLSTISIAVVGLYQWYIKNETLKANNKLSIENAVLTLKSNRLSKANSQLRKEERQNKQSIKETTKKNK